MNCHFLDNSRKKLEKKRGMAFRLNVFINNNEKRYCLEKRIIKYLKENLILNYHPNILKMEHDFTKGQENLMLEFYGAMRHLIDAELIFNKKDPMGGNRVYINEFVRALGVEYLALEETRLETTKLKEYNKQINKNDF